MTKSETQNLANSSVGSASDNEDDVHEANDTNSMKMKESRKGDEWEKQSWGD